MSRHLPPQWMLKFFRWFCREELCDAVEGDLLILYAKHRKKGHRFRADLWYLLNVFTFVQPFALKRSKYSHRLNTLDMIRNYLKIAYRNLSRSKSYAAINIFGLAIGLSAFIIMATYVHHELSYDRFHEKSDRIFRIGYQYVANGTSTEVAKSAFPLKPMFLNEYPEVEKVVRFYENRQDATTLKYEDNHFTEESILFADPEVFQVFDFELEEGDPTSALSKMNSIVMTRSAARRYFGNDDPMGKVVKYKNDDPLEVTGILKEVPANSHLSFDMLVPMELQRQRWIRGTGNNGYDFEQDWKWSGSWQYVLLKTPESIHSFNTKLYEEGKDFFGRNNRVEYHYSGMPLTDIHLNSDMAGEFQANGNERQVYGFGVIAVLILTIACINFVNLSTARSSKRAKEVGLRKVMGALKPQLIWQFIAESTLIAFIAMLVAIFMVEAMLPFFNNFMDKSLDIPYLEQPWIILIYLIGTVGIGLLAGLYPAFYLSRFQPVKTLKGQISHGNGGSNRMRKVLVTTQFLVSNLLIIGILIVQSQLEYIRSKDLGFDKDQVLILKHGTKLDDDFNVFNERIKSSPYITAANLGYIAGTRDWTQSFRIEGEAREEGKSIGIKHVGFDFMEMFDLDLVAGRYFSREMFRDSRRSVLLNEKAVKHFGWTNEEALNKRLSYVGGSDNKTLFECKVIGVLADAHMESLYKPIRPSVFKFALWGDISIKLNVSNIEEVRTALADIEEVWNDMSPQWPFEYEFLDDVIADQYIKEERLSQTVQYFAFLAIFVACLGLFGLASFTVQERTKEIGVRKVLGASMQSILVLVSKKFLLLIGLSFLVSVPLGIYLGSNWLQEFEYRTTIGPMIFVISGLISLGIAAAAVAGQSVKAARSNPVKTLRYE